MKDNIELRNLSEENCAQEIFSDEVAENQNGVEISFIPAKNLNENLRKVHEKIYETEELKEFTLQMYDFLHCTTIDYLLLAGEYSSGRTTIVENVVQKVISKKAPKVLWDFTFLQYDAKDFIGQSGEDFFGSMAIAIDELCQSGKFQFVLYVKHLEFFTEEILMVLHKFYARMLEAYPSLDLKFVFSVYYTFLEEAKEFPFLMRAGIKQVETPKYADLFKILMPKVKALEKLHNVEFPNQHLKYLFTLIMSNEGSDVFIKKYIYYIDLVLTRVELNQGKQVELKDIYSVFNKIFSDWKSLPEAERVRISFHEAGHTVLGLVSLDEYYHLMAVTGIPSMNTSSLGATIEFFKTELYNVDKKLLKKFSAFYLAGREAELLAGFHSNNGVKSDLERLSEMLVDTIATTGMFSGISKNFAYDFEAGVSEEALWQIENEAKRFGKKAAKYARKILTENWSLVEAIANKLIIKGLVEGEEVYKIYKKHLKNQKK